MIWVPLQRPETTPLPPSDRLQPPLVGDPSAEASQSLPVAGTTRRSRRSTVTTASSSSKATPSASSSREGSLAVSASTPSTSARSSPDINIPSFATSSKNAQRDLARVWEAVIHARRIVVVCGAGISVSSPANIPDFRSSTGLFRSLKEQHPDAGLTSGKDLFDARLFSSESNTALFYSMIASLHSMTLDAQPTLFHHLLKRLDEQGRLQRVYTQNIDALEERAGLTFGLGEGAKRTFQRTASLGKRKRNGKGAQADAPDTNDDAESSLGRRRPTWQKTQSAPAISLTEGSSSSKVAGAQLGQPSPEPTAAMFPRVIPLHGSLAKLVCTVCDYKMSTLPTPDQETTQAMQALADGDAPVCPACSERDSVRLAAGLRSRGIGKLKPDVVLYNGDNKSGERVGECLERDVLGLRDRLDGPVPETTSEEKARLKREQKDAEKRQQTTAVKQEEDGFPSGSLLSAATSALDVSMSFEQPGQDVLGSLFEQDEDEDAELEAAVGPSSTSRASSILTDLSTPPLSTKTSPNARLSGGRKGMQRSITQPASGSSRTMGASSSSAPRKQPLKPLPPDLLIVAGTSLKVPGTKRVVREFAKACRAQDGIVPKGCKSGKGKSKRGNSRETSKTPSADKDGSDDEQEDEDEDDEGSLQSVEDGSNPHRPLRTVLLNYDFPIPAKEWEDVFDVWVQGDVQASAGGLWSASRGYAKGTPLIDDGVDDENNEEGPTIQGVPTWKAGMDIVDAEREAKEIAETQTKKAARGMERSASFRGSKTMSRENSSTSNTRKEALFNSRARSGTLTGRKKEEDSTEDAVMSGLHDETSKSSLAEQFDEELTLDETTSTKPAKKGRQSVGSSGKTKTAANATTLARIASSSNSKAGRKSGANTETTMDEIFPVVKAGKSGGAGSGLSRKTSMGLKRKPSVKK